MAGMKVAVVALLLLAGCGGGSSGPACPPPLVGSCTNHSGFFCTEYSGVPSPGPEALMNACKGDPDAKDTWSPAGCNQGDKLGACKRMQGGLCVAVWVKAEPGILTRDEAVMMCAEQKGTWVDR